MRTSTASSILRTTMVCSELQTSARARGIANAVPRRCDCLDFLGNAVCYGSPDGASQAADHRGRVVSRDITNSARASSSRRRQQVLRQRSSKGKQCPCSANNHSADCLRACSPCVSGLCRGDAEVTSNWFHRQHLTTHWLRDYPRWRAARSQGQASEG